MTEIKDNFVPLMILTLPFITLQNFKLCSHYNLKFLLQTHLNLVIHFIFNSSYLCLKHYIIPGRECESHLVVCHS